MGNHTTHGYTGTPTYAAWHNIVSRCTNPNRWHKPRRFITPRWRVFANFLHDMGPCPDGCELRLLYDHDTYRKGACFWRPAHEPMRGYKLTDRDLWGATPTLASTTTE